jgi:hypothetical protein
MVKIVHQARWLLALISGLCLAIIPAGLFLAILTGDEG